MVLLIFKNKNWLGAFFLMKSDPVLRTWGSAFPCNYLRPSICVGLWHRTGRIEDVQMFVDRLSLSTWLKLYMWLRVFYFPISSYPVFKCSQVPIAMSQFPRRKKKNLRMMNPTVLRRRRPPSISIGMTNQLLHEQQEQLVLKFEFSFLFPLNIVFRST